MFLFLFLAKNELSLLENELHGYLLLSRSDSTVRKYSNYYELWKIWAARYEVTPLPADDKNVALFLVGLLREGKSSHVVESIVYAIRWKQQISGLHDTLGGLTRNMVETAKRIAKPRRVPKEPITPDMLKQMYDLIKGEDADLLRLRKYTILLLSFAGFMRFDEVSQLKKEDIRTFSTYMTVFLEKSKTDVYRDGRTLVISRLCSPCCPVKTVEKYFLLGNIEKGETFLFRAVTPYKHGKYKFRAPNKPLYYTTCRRDALELFSKIGLNPKLFGLHSARSGGATAAANRGVPDRLFKRHGRWVSDKAKDGYIKDNLINLLSVSRSLGL